MTIKFSKMAGGRHLGFERNANGANRSSDPENLPLWTKCEVDCMTRCGDIADFSVRVRISAKFLLRAIGRKFWWRIPNHRSRFPIHLQ